MPFQELEEFSYADLFPEWNEGVSLLRRTLETGRLVGRTRAPGEESSAWGAGSRPGSGSPFSTSFRVSATDTIESISALYQQEIARSREIVAGASLDDVAQVVLYITRIEDKPAIDEVYARFFRRPYPSRACVVVAGLVVPGTRLEVLAYAAMPR